MRVVSYWTFVIGLLAWLNAASPIELVVEHVRTSEELVRFQSLLPWGWPRVFFWLGEFRLAEFCFDVGVWLVILIGTIPAIKRWSARGVLLRFSLASTLALPAAIAFYFTARSKDLAITVSEFNAALNVLVCVPFGIAVVGWLQIATSVWCHLPRQATESHRNRELVADE